jgi:hypothetical protein
MEVIAHRGYWLSSAEQNGEIAFRRALLSTYGIETDLRDYCGKVVISHDAASDTSMQFDAFLDIYKSYNSHPILALNVKADGLHAPIAEALKRFHITNYFLFDMSVPDTLSYFAYGLTVFTRRSEFELGSALDGRAAGLWLDSFEQPYVDPNLVRSTLAEGRRIAIVSPELHRRPHERAWTLWRDALMQCKVAQGQVLICTDFPDEASRFFSVNA